MKSQKKLVLEFLLKGKSLSQREAFAFWGIKRLSAIIYSLKKEGFLIESQRKKNYTKYCLSLEKIKKIDYDFR